MKNGMNSNSLPFSRNVWFKPRQSTPWLTICLVYLVHQFIVFSSGYFGQSLLAGRKAHLEPVVTILKGLTRWDGGWYLRIATEGYTFKSAAFFPLYPLLIRTLQGMGIAPETGALLIPNLSFFLILVVFYRLVSLDYDDSVTVRSLWYLALFPTAFYFSAMYTESLYLLLVLLTLYLGRTRQWFLASLCGMLAGMSRNLGIFLLIPLLYEYWSQENQAFKSPSLKAKVKLLWLALMPAGLGIYMLYLRQVLGNPLAFMAAQKYWKRSFDFPWNSIYEAIVNISVGNNLWNLIFTLYALAFLALAVKLLRPAYTMYMFFGLVVPLTSPAVHSPLLSLPRFVLVLFPIYIVLALLVKREQVHWALLCSSTALMVYLHMFFANSRWVA